MWEPVKGRLELEIQLNMVAERGLRGQGEWLTRWRGGRHRDYRRLWRNWLTWEPKWGDFRGPTHCFNRQWSGDLGYRE